jgi:hypothetical protein
MGVDSSVPGGVSPTCTADIFVADVEEGEGRGGTLLVVFVSSISVEPTN